MSCPHRFECAVRPASSAAYPNESVEFSIGNADAEGKVAFDDDSQLGQFIGSCNQDQSFQDVVAVVTDVASGDTITRNPPLVHVVPPVALCHQCRRRLSNAMTHRAALTCVYALLSLGALGCDGRNGGTADAGEGGVAPIGSEGGSGGGAAASEGGSEGAGSPTQLGCEAVLGAAVDVSNLPSCEALAFEGSGATAGALELRGHLTDAEGLPIVGARIELSGDASAVRYSDLTGGYGFRVDAGAYTLDVTAECGFETSSVELAPLDGDTSQDFVAVDAGCLVARLVNATANGALFSLQQSGVQLASSSALIEERGTVDDALARLQQIAEERPIAVCELSIDDGPAIERRAVVVSQGPLGSEDEVSQVNLTTAVAVETQVVRFEGILPAAATCDAVERVLAAARAFTAAQLPELRKQTP